MYPVNQLYLLCVQLPSVIPCIDSIFQKFPLQEKVDHRGIRTPNRPIRSQTPYPLDPAALCPVNCICCLFSCQVLSLILTSVVRNFLCVKQNVDYRGIRTPNLLIQSQMPYPLGHAAMNLVNQLYLLFVQLPSVIPCIDSLSKKFHLQEKVDHGGIRNPNLLIRSQTPYPLGHAAMYPVNCMCCLFSCQVLSLILTSVVRTFLCVKRSVNHRGIRTPNLLIRSQTPYPLGHAPCQLYLLLLQLPSVVPCIDSISKKFPLCQAKNLQQRDSTPQSSDSKSDALSVGPCGHASCQTIVSVICSVAKCCPLYRLDI